MSVFKNRRSVVFLVILTGCTALFGCQAFKSSLSRGGTVYVVQVTPDAGSGDQIENAERVLRSRLEAVGFSTEIHRPEGFADRLEIKVYGAVDQPDALKSLLTTTHKLELKAIVSPPNPTPVVTYPSRINVPIADDEEILPYSGAYSEQNRFLVVKRTAIVTGEDVRDAYAMPESGSIYFSLKPDGAARLYDWTARNTGNYLAIVLDGNVQSAPYIRGPISDSGVIDGRFSEAAAEEIALTLKSGYLPAKITLVEERKF